MEVSTAGNMRQKLLKDRSLKVDRNSSSNSSNSRRKAIPLPFGEYC